MLRLFPKSAIPPVATNRVYLITKDHLLHRILRAVSMNSKLSRLTDQDTCREHNDLNLPRAMIDQFPHAPEAIANTLKIADCCFTDWDFNRVVFPRFEKMNDEEAYHHLYEATMEGCRRRYGEITQAVKDRVAHEMRIIRRRTPPTTSWWWPTSPGGPSAPAAGGAPRHPSSPTPWKSHMWTPSATTSFLNAPSTLVEKTPRISMWISHGMSATR